MQDYVISHSLTQTKLQRPRIGHELVFRPRLLEQLDQQRALTLVLAPAGYGKTTLLCTWLAACDRPSAWLTLDEYDNDLAVFTTYFVAAVQTIYPDVGAETITLLNSATRPPLSTIARSLLNELDTIEQEFILVLDDCHTVNDKAIHDLLIELLRHPPHALHLVLIARHEPSLPLASFRARGPILELRTAELRFSLEETAFLLREVMEIQVDDQILALLKTKTEGWPIGLRLAALYLRHKGTPGMLVADSSGYNRYVMDYLVSEVLSQLPASIQAFLIKTSILDQLCGPLCEAVTGLQDHMFNGQTHLDWLERAGLFLAPLDEGRRWYRYHHLFRQILQHQLRLQHVPAEIATLYVRASTWFAQNGYIEEALHYALAGNDTMAAVQLIAEHRHTLINEEKWQRLERWLQLFSGEVVDDQPDLLLSQAWIMYTQHRLSEVPAILDRAESLIARLPLDPASAERLQGEVEARRCSLYYYTGDGTRCVLAAQRALEKLPAEWWNLRASTRQYLSGGYLMAGDLTRAYATLYDSGEPDYGRMSQMRMLGSACFIHWTAADLSGMAQAAGQVIAWGERLEQTLSVSWARYCMGIFHYQRNDLAQAEKYLSPIVLQPYAVNVMCFLNSAVALALIHQAQGRPDLAREIADVVLSFALETHNAAMLSAAQAFLAELALRQGRLAEAIQWCHQYGPLKLAPMPFFYAPPMTLARILLAQDSTASLEQARQVLAQLHDHVTMTHNTRCLIEVLALRALLYDALDREPKALIVLEQAVQLAEPGGFIRLFVDLGPRLERLLAKLAQCGVARAYIARIRAAFGTVDIQPAAHPEKILPAPMQQRPPILAETLTNREMDVLLLLSQRFTNKEIAQTLGIAPNTVKQHTLTLFHKLQVGDRRQAVTRARENGLLPPL